MLLINAIVVTLRVGREAMKKMVHCENNELFALYVGASCACESRSSADERQR